MKSAEIRRSFLEYFRDRGHEVRPSSSLVPAGDPTLLFVNAGMVQFKEAFLGVEKLPFHRAATSQKCVRAGGKHNDLEEVGRTARHHTFFEMLGNFSFGDYFKREAIDYAWGFLTGEMGLNPGRLFVTVHRSDADAAKLWTEVAGVAPERIHALGDSDNFWQMADTGPCGPCSEIHYDLRAAADRERLPDTREFEAATERGEILELWNLVFMQFDRDAAGLRTPLPAPSIDTGLGLERLAAVMQGADSNYHTDLFLPLLDRVAGVVGRRYDARGSEGVSFRVIADHARAVAFLAGDGVHPSNEGRGYVLRRILRRGVRHAWLLGRREPTLTQVVDAVVEGMKEAYPGLETARAAVLETTRREEERFLATIDGGMARLDEVAPALETGTSPRPVIPGREIFRLYDTFGFPADLTALAAVERGYDLDMEGFEAALEEQRARSRGWADEVTVSITRKVEVVPAPWRFLPGWKLGADGREQRFAAYDEELAVETRVVGALAMRGKVNLVLAENPFYAEAGGQLSDRGRVAGPGWTLAVEQVRREGDHLAVCGSLASDSPDTPPAAADLLGTTVRAAVDRARRRDVERNHTATHLLHAALRSVLGPHVRQRGSLVAPDRLRFDFAHSSPLTATELERVAGVVREGVWASHPVRTRVERYGDAVRAGAMALFGEKYGDEVRVVEIPGTSLELCGGTHVRRTGEIGPFVVLSESGVAAGVRRIEALTGRGAARRLEEYRERIEALAGTMRAVPANLERRVEELIAEKAALEALVDELQEGGGGGEEILAEARLAAGEGALTVRAARIRVRGAADARGWGDRFRKSAPHGAAVVAAVQPGGRCVLFAFATESAIAAGVRADAIVREVAAQVGGRGGGRPHMAQAGVGNVNGVADALRGAPAVVERLLSG